MEMATELEKAMELEERAEPELNQVELELTQAEPELILVEQELEEREQVMEPETIME